MNDDLAIITTAYEMMRRERIVRSKAEFSRQWLMQSPSYLSSAQTRNRRPQKRVLEQLASRLRVSLAGLAKIGPIYSETLRKRAIAFVDASAVIEMGLVKVSQPEPRDEAVAGRLAATLRAPPSRD